MKIYFGFENKQFVNISKTKEKKWWKETKETKIFIT